jgi:hypothetical protein
LVGTGKIEQSEHGLLRVVDDVNEIVDVVGAAFERQATATLLRG